jgi:hypothetical protein
MGDDCYEQGINALTEGKLDDALKCFDQAIRVFFIIIDFVLTINFISSVLSFQ